ncbi:N-acetylmuramoyl-L-alanine amidase [Ornithinibacillus caprae]|uniref:N-acetylmuramoyl-L-alanine amidase n=1 Tax=Ornithinibacillus caprae TaxID=2678566 RepID=UPI001FE65C48|nr:N-acetylmuramoyl-L-alanine amidase [Ornithinibacillus caprae]
MQRKIKLLIAMGVILFILPINQIVYANEAIINVDNLNVRSGPGTNFGVVGQIHTDETYKIIQIDDEWVEIQLETGTGWVSREFITTKGDQEETSPSIPIEGEKSIEIVFENTQIRNGPSTDYDIIDFVNKGTKLNVVAETEDWYQIENDSVEGYVLKKLVDKQDVISSGFEDKTIVIDAGHGGRDVGAIGVNETYEKNLTYKTAQELAQELTQLGAEVILTRSADEYIFLSSRSAISNNLSTDAFISIHYDSIPELPSVSGISTYYYHDQNEELAKYIQQGVIKETGANDRKASHGDYQVLRQNYKPAVLMELGFMSNSEEELLLLTNAYQKKIVSGIIEGLGKYFANN